MPEEAASGSLGRQQFAAKIIAAYVRRNQVAASEVPALISTVYATLAQLGTAPSSESARTPAVPLRRSVSHEYVVCLECGWRGRTLRRHLMSRHALDPTAYRARWQLPETHLLVSPGYSERRAALARQIGLGRRAPASRLERRPRRASMGSIGVPHRRAPNRRASPRRRVRQRAHIVFLSGNGELNCQIVDLSETGAKLVTDNVLACPEKFQLKPRIGEPNICEVVWRTRDRLGVRFID